MGNSESTCSPQEDDCKEAETKLMECALAHLTPKVVEIGTKTLEEGYKAAFDADDDKYEEYMKGGPCKESYMAYVESSDKDSHDKDITMMECLEAHSDYYHKFLDFYNGGPEQKMPHLHTRSCTEETPCANPPTFLVLILLVNSLLDSEKSIRHFTLRMMRMNVLWVTDRVYGGECPTRQVYESGTKEIALSVVKGINCTLSSLENCTLSSLENFFLRPDE
ncbi:hypothetical protein F2Q68_00029662 [Brassica cretica]|uniref:GCK domain-containing protein n=1 Tax=Brassica cretica TaxID=69181 RepID=A0A8S9GHT1_BRACR|nr:hypothetical protein F2Q68_00029662 [Brassica cretica]